MALSPDVCKQIEDLLKKAETGSLVASASRALAVLEQHNHAFQAKISSRHVVCHPANRDGCGVCAADVHSLLSDILSIGFDPSQPKPVCVECSGDGAIEAFNTCLVEDSAGMLAPVIPGSCKYASLSSSHTNQVLRLLAAGCNHVHDSEAGAPDITVQGKLSMEQLAQRDPLFHSAASEGMTWTVVGRAALERFPSLGPLLQEAGNTSGQLQRKETELQLARRIHREFLKVASSKPPGSSVSYQELRAQVLRSKPSCTAAIPFIFTFLRKYSGGSSAEALNETEQAIRMFGVSSQRELGADFWDSLGRDMRGGAPLLRLRHALLRAAIIKPERGIASADARRLSSVAFKELALQCDWLMVEMRSLLATYLANVDKELDVLKELYDFEMTVVSVALGKKSKDAKQALPHTIEQAAQAFVEKVALLKQVTISKQMRSYDAGGRLQSPSGLARECGFTEGMHILRKGDGTVAQVVQFEESHLVVAVNGQLRRVEAGSFTRGEWTKHTPKAQVVTLDHMANPAGGHADFLVQLMKANILQAIHELQQENGDTEGLSVHLKPCKRVVAEQDYKKKCLKLVPVSTKIECKPVGSASGQGTPMGELVPGMEFSILPWVVIPKDGTAGAVCPFFFVQPTTTQEESNMELVTIKASNGMDIPLLRNFVAIQKGDDLKVHKPKDTVVLELAPLEKVETSKPSKRARTKQPDLDG
ncbi:unnamed protein product [Effrenium voratum]|uniref:Uncharacterized protein n=1 Tax=Effrenium voratum TaxID=2562239 RepID=A0AA36J6W8_9DINO|nr:unnamed protein product [Effrenium voratum]